MVFNEKTIILKDGRNAVLKSPSPEDAEKLLKFIRQACGETDFLARYPEEWDITAEQEAAWINNLRSSPNTLPIACYVDREIVGNCDIQLMLGCTDDLTAEHFSDRSGDMSIQIDTTMTVRQTIAVAQVIPQYRHTEGQGRRKVLTPDEVLRLPNTQMLCIIRGCNVLKLDKLDYTKHPMAKQISKISVMDYYPNTHKNNMHVEIIDGDAHKSADLSDSEKSCVNLNQNADMDNKESQRGTVLTDSETARQNVLPDCERAQKSNEENAVSAKPTEKKRLYSSAKPPDDF